MVCLRQIVSVRKPTLDQYRHFSTGGSLVAGRFLDSNGVNNVKDSFLPCEALALLQQVVVYKILPSLGMALPPVLTFSTLDS